MIKPKRLKKGDKIAIVSLSWGGLGDPQYIHKYALAKERLENDFGLEVVAMPHALRGSEFVDANPALRAKDLMDAFLDPSIAAIFCAIGGDDTIRLLPYIDFDIIKNNPKIFMGYSDTTVNHFMMAKAGLVSFYGPSIMGEFSDYVRIPEYTQQAVKKFLFEDTTGYQIPSSPLWSDDFIFWDEKNSHKERRMRQETHGYELLQGSGIVRGHLMGGCIDVFSMVTGTTIWPTLPQWQGAILFIETSEDKPEPTLIKYALRSLAAQGILKAIRGIIVGKPQGEVYYEEYKAVIRQVICHEEKRPDLPVLYNINIGHACPIGILPCGIQVELNCEEKTITVLENATVGD